MAGFDNDTVYANNADFSRAGSGGGSAANGLQLNGQLWIGRTVVNAGGTHIDVGTLTSTGGTLTITNGAGTINLEVAGGGAVTETLTGNTGGAVAPLAANINTVGTGSITIAGNAGTHTLTTQLTGLNNHAVLVGAGTATITNVGPSALAGQILQSAGAAADPAFSTATYPSTTTINQILYSSSSNVVAGLTAGNNGVLISGTTGIPSWLANGTTGQVLTATTGNPPSWANPATSGTVTSVSVVTANGFSGSVANPTTTPAITITTTQTGLLTGNGTAIIGTPINQYSVLTADASNLPNSVAPAATVGIPLISKGVVAQPDFGTAVVAGGGTGDTSFVAYTPICGGTTTTNPLQSVVSNATAGYVLTSNGAAALPTFQPAPGAGGGSWQFIETKSGSNVSTIVFNTSISSFTELMFTFTGVNTFSSTLGLFFKVSADGGSTFVSGTRSAMGTNAVYSPSVVPADSELYYACLQTSDPASLAPASGYFLIENTPGSLFRISTGDSFNANALGTRVLNLIGASSVINYVRFSSQFTFNATINAYGR